MDFVDYERMDRRTVDECDDFIITVGLSEKENVTGITRYEWGARVISVGLPSRGHHVVLENQLRNLGYRAKR